MPILRTAKPAYKGARPCGTPAFRLSPMAETQSSSRNVPAIWNISVFQTASPFSVWRHYRLLKWEYFMMARIENEGRR